MFLTDEEYIKILLQGMNIQDPFTYKEPYVYVGDLVFKFDKKKIKLVEV